MGARTWKPPSLCLQLPPNICLQLLIVGVGASLTLPLAQKEGSLASRSLTLRQGTQGLGCGVGDRQRSPIRVLSAFPRHYQVSVEAGMLLSYQPPPPLCHSPTSSPVGK